MLERDNFYIRELAWFYRMFFNLTISGNTVIIKDLNNIRIMSLESLMTDYLRVPKIIKEAKLGVVISDMSGFDITMDVKEVLMFRFRTREPGNLLVEETVYRNISIPDFIYQIQLLHQKRIRKRQET